MLYTSETQQITLWCKVAPAEGVPYDQAAAALTSLARSAAISFEQTDAQPYNTTGPHAGSAGAGGAGAGGAAGGGNSGGRGRWLGHLAEVQCLRGCVEVILRLQYIGEPLDEHLLGQALRGLDQELRRRMSHRTPGAGAAVACDGHGVDGGGAEAVDLAPAGASTGEAAESAAADGGGGYWPLSMTLMSEPVWSLSRSRPGGGGGVVEGADTAAAAAPAGSSASAGTSGRTAAGPVRAVRIAALLDPPVLQVSGRGSTGTRTRSSSDCGQGAGAGAATGSGTNAPERGPEHAVRPAAAAWLHLFLDEGDGAAVGGTCSARPSDGGSKMSVDDARDSSDGSVGGGSCNGRAGWQRGRHPAHDGAAASASAPPPPPPLLWLPTLDVRVVVTQYGTVVAEVERLTVERRGGASVRLDLSGLQEGSAALLILPCQPQAAALPPHASGTELHHDVGVTHTAQGGRVAALLLVTLAVAPPAVAEELFDLMTVMEQAAAEAAEVAPLTDPRVVRARAFTQHFSALVSDITSLLLGCELLVKEADFSFSGQEHEVSHVDEVCGLATALLSYLAERRLEATQRYLLQEVVHAVWLTAGQLARHRRPLLEPAEQQQKKHQGVTQPGAAQDVPASAPLSSAPTSEHPLGPQLGRGRSRRTAGSGPAGASTGKDGEAADRGDVTKAGALPPRQSLQQRSSDGHLFEALRDAVWGCRDPAAEADYHAHRCRQSGPGDLAAGALNIVLLLLTSALVLSGGICGFCTCKGSAGGSASRGATRAGPQSPASLSSLRIRIPPNWAVVQMTLCGASLVLPALLLLRWTACNRPRVRDFYLRASHVTYLILTYMYGELVAPHADLDQRLRMPRLACWLASLMVLIQPVSYSVHLRGNQCTWLADLMMLTPLLRGAEIAAAAAANAPRVPEAGWSSWLGPVVFAAALLLASVLLAAARELSWRAAFLAARMTQQQQ